MIIRTLKYPVVLCCLCLISLEAYSGYRTFLDPRSMAMGGTGAASASKFNASYHNPALIAFNRGDKPDKIHISTSQGLREIYTGDLEKKLIAFQESDLTEDLIDPTKTSTIDGILDVTGRYYDAIKDLNLESYRKDEMVAFNILADTLPVTLNFYLRSDYREMTVIRNLDDELLSGIISQAEAGITPNFTRIGTDISSTVDDTTYKITEFGVTVATTNVIDYNIPISWGFTPKLHQVNASHQARKIEGYDLNNREGATVSQNQLEWNLDVGFAALLTDDFITDVMGLDGWWLEGEWVFGFVGMNLFPTDFTPFRVARDPGRYPGTKRAIQANYQVGLAHYREDYMVTADLDLNEAEVYSFEGMTRFLSLGSEYYWRDDFHLRAGLRFNLSQTSEGGKDKALISGGFLYQAHQFSLEASALFNDEERGGSVGVGLAF